MNSLEFEKHFNNVVKRSSEVLLKKRTEYASDKDVLINFKNSVGLSFHNTPASVAWEFNVKHLQSLKDIITEIENENYARITKELLNEKFGDIINYFILMEAIIKEQTEIEL